MPFRARSPLTYGLAEHFGGFDGVVAHKLANLGIRKSVVTIWAQSEWILYKVSHKLKLVRSRYISVQNHKHKPTNSTYNKISVWLFRTGSAHNHTHSGKSLIHSVVTFERLYAPCLLAIRINDKHT